MDMLKNLRSAVGYESHLSWTDIGSIAPITGVPSKAKLIYINIC